MDKILRIGTRVSRLALVQTELVKKAVSERFPDIKCETVAIRTKGDIIRNKPISELGGSGVFAGEVERALLSGEIDIAVHSAKDLPTLLANGLEVRCVLKRADPRDIILFRKGTDPMFGSPVIGTGSVRRRAGFRNIFPDSSPRFLDIRGNVDTRIEKLRSGAYDAIILAAAGLERLGLLPFDDKDISCEMLPLDRFLPAPCQAIIAVESRAGEFTELLGAVNDRDTYVSFCAERYVLQLLGGDCSKPVGAYSSVGGGRIALSVGMGGTPLTAEGEADEFRELAEGLVKQL